MRRLFGVVGDIDFFEYRPSDVQAEECRFDDNLNLLNDLLCSEVRVGKHTWMRPWSNGAPSGMLLRQVIEADDDATIKMDYFGSIDGIGVSEISNIIGTYLYGIDSGPTERTFSFQEIPLTMQDVLPNRLDNPWEMGRYIDWLITQVHEYRDGPNKNIMKALKRSASLSRLLFLPQFTDEIYLLAMNNSVLTASRLQDLEALLPKLVSCGVASQDELYLSITHEIQDLQRSLTSLGGPPEALEKQRFDEEGGGITGRLVRTVESWGRP